VATNWFGELTQVRSQVVGGGEGAAHGVDEPVDLVGGVEDDAGEQLLLIGEVLVHGLLGDRGLGRDLIHAAALVPGVEEDGRGRFQDRPALAGRPAFVAGLHRLSFPAPRHAAPMFADRT
jgi:hypothetical protein